MHAAERAANAPARILPAAPFLWRLPAIETYPRWIDFVQTTAGKLVLFVAFAGLMKLHSVGLWTAENGMWLILTVVATFVAAAGERRHLALMLCAGTLLAYRPNWFEFGAAFMTLEREGLAGSVPREYLRTGILLGCAPIAVAMILLARRYRKHPLGRRPVLAQHVVFLLLLALALTQWLHGLPQVVLWAVIATFASYFSYLAYALIDQRRPKPESLTLQLACFNPLGFPTPVPMGKGAANWRSVEAQTEHELAVTQLSGLKLLVWALMLEAFCWGCVCCSTVISACRHWKARSTHSCARDTCLRRRGC